MSPQLTQEWAVTLKSLLSRFSFPLSVLGLQIRHLMSIVESLDELQHGTSRQQFRAALSDAIAASDARWVPQVFDRIFSSLAMELTAVSSDQRALDSMMAQACCWGVRLFAALFQATTAPACADSVSGNEPQLTSSQEALLASLRTNMCMTGPLHLARLASLMEACLQQREAGSGMSASIEVNDAHSLDMTIEEVQHLLPTLLLVHNRPSAQVQRSAGPMPKAPARVRTLLIGIKDMCTALARRQRALLTANCAIASELTPAMPLPVEAAQQIQQDLRSLADLAALLDATVSVGVDVHAQQPRGAAAGSGAWASGGLAAGGGVWAGQGQGGQGFQQPQQQQQQQQQQQAYQWHAPQVAQEVRTAALTAVVASSARILETLLMLQRHEAATSGLREGAGPELWPASGGDSGAEDRTGAGHGGDVGVSEGDNEGEEKGEGEGEVRCRSADLRVRAGAASRLCSLLELGAKLGETVCQENMHYGALSPELLLLMGGCPGWGWGMHGSHGPRRSALLQVVEMHRIACRCLLLRRPPPAACMRGVPGEGGAGAGGGESAGVREGGAGASGEAWAGVGGEEEAAEQLLDTAVVGVHLAAAGTLVDLHEPLLVLQLLDSSLIPSRIPVRWLASALRSYAGAPYTCTQAPAAATHHKLLKVFLQIIGGAVRAAVLDVQDAADPHVADPQVAVSEVVGLQAEQIPESPIPGIPLASEGMLTGTGPRGGVSGTGPWGASGQQLPGSFRRHEEQLLPAAIDKQASRPVDGEGSREGSCDSAGGSGGHGSSESSGAGDGVCYAAIVGNQRRFGEVKAGDVKHATLGGAWEDASSTSMGSSTGSSSSSSDGSNNSSGSTFSYHATTPGAEPHAADVPFLQTASQTQEALFMHAGFGGVRQVTLRLLTCPSIKASGVQADCEDALEPELLQATLLCASLGSEPCGPQSGFGVGSMAGVARQSGWGARVREGLGEVALVAGAVHLLPAVFAVAGKALDTNINTNLTFMQRKPSALGRALIQQASSVQRSCDMALTCAGVVCYAPVHQAQHQAAAQPAAPGLEPGGRATGRSAPLCTLLAVHAAGLEPLLRRLVGWLKQSLRNMEVMAAAGKGEEVMLVGQLVKRDHDSLLTAAVACVHRVLRLIETVAESAARGAAAAAGAERGPCRVAAGSGAPALGAEGCGRAGPPGQHWDSVDGVPHKVSQGRCSTATAEGRAWRGTASTVSLCAGLCSAILDSGLFEHMAEARSPDSEGDEAGEVQHGLQARKPAATGGGLRASARPPHSPGEMERGERDEGRAGVPGAGDQVKRLRPQLPLLAQVLACLNHCGQALVLSGASGVGGGVQLRSFLTVLDHGCVAFDDLAKAIEACEQVQKNGVRQTVPADLGAAMQAMHGSAVAKSAAQAKLLSEARMRARDKVTSALSAMQGRHPEGFKTAGLAARRAAEAVDALRAAAVTLGNAADACAMVDQHSSAGILQHAASDSNRGAEKAAPGAMDTNAELANIPSVALSAMAEDWGLLLYHCPSIRRATAGMCGNMLCHRAPCHTRAGHALPPFPGSMEEARGDIRGSPGALQCSGGCGVWYCCQGCLTQALERGHARHCSGVLTADAP